MIFFIKKIDRLYGNNEIFSIGLNIFQVEKKCRSMTQCVWKITDVISGREDAVGELFDYTLAGIYSDKKDIIRRIYEI